MAELENPAAAKQKPLLQEACVWLNIRLPGICYASKLFYLNLRLNVKTSEEKRWYAWG